VTQAANEREGVFDVIQATVIWPDLRISNEGNGFIVEGTVYVQTMVLQN
jgi:hypothetical protein